MAISAYTKTTWANSPTTTSPVSAANLQHIEDQVKDITDTVRTPVAYSPVLAFGGSSAGITYATQSGWSIKIGRIVFFGGLVELTNKGSASGAATISLPETASSTYYSTTSLSLYAVTFANAFESRIFNSATVLDLYEITESGTRTTLTNSDFANNSAVFFSGQYISAS